VGGAMIKKSVKKNIKNQDKLIAHCYISGCHRLATRKIGKKFYCDEHKNIVFQRNYFVDGYYIYED
jgi:hypothetical protein